MEFVTVFSCSCSSPKLWVSESPSCGALAINNFFVLRKLPNFRLFCPQPRLRTPGRSSCSVFKSSLASSLKKSPPKEEEELAYEAQTIKICLKLKDTLMEEQRPGMKTHSWSWSPRDEVRPNVRQGLQRGSFLIGPKGLKYTTVSPG